MSQQPTQAKLGLFDAVCIILGIIIGAGIYETPRTIFGMLPDPIWTLGIWAVCGLLALVGALCYAELATAYPRSGGDYVYHTRAYGPLAGYLFGWTQLAVIQTSSIGLMAYVFANYGQRLWKIPGLEQYTTVVYAAAAILVMSLLNILGVVLGKLAQNLLTLAKVIGLGAIIVAGFAFAPKESVVYDGTLVSVTSEEVTIDATGGKKSFKLTDDTKLLVDGNALIKADKDDPGRKVVVSDFKPSSSVRVVTDLKDFSKARKLRTRPVPSSEASAPGLPNFSLVAFAMVLVFLTYGGWNDAAFVAAEVRNPSKNIPLALIIGTAGVMVIYLLVNGAYIMGLGGFEGAQEAGEVAADVLTLLPWEFGEKAMSILVMISALGAVNGLIFTSSRIYATMGSDYSLFAPLGKWNRALGTPIWSLLLQMLISLGMVVAVGTPQGRQAIVDVLTFLGQSPPSAGQLEGEGGFYLLLRCTAPIFWIFFLMTGMALFVLRINDAHVARPFRVPLYPVLPLIFCATCGYMVYSGIGYAGSLGLVGALLVVLGIPFYIFSRRSAQAEVALPGSST